MTNQIIKNVARTIVEKQEWAWGLDFENCLSGDKEHAEEVAKAAILATIDALMEPSEQAKMGAVSVAFDRGLDGQDGIGASDMLALLQTILTQAKKEIETP